MVIIDTANNDAYLFNTFMSLAKTVGLKPLYKPWYHVDKKTIDDNDVLLIVLDELFFVALSQEIQIEHMIKNPVLKKILSIIDWLSCSTNKLIGFIVPSGTSMCTVLSPLICQLLRRLRFFDQTVDLEKVMSACLTHFLSSDSLKSFQYATTLLPPRAQNTRLLSLPSLLLSLPTKLLDNGDDERLLPLQPLAVVTKNTSTNNIFFISSTSSLFFSEINEHITLNPLDFKLREKILKDIQLLLAQLYYQHIGYRPVDDPLPFFLTEQCAHQKKKNIQSKRVFSDSKKSSHFLYKNGLKCGWMAIETYYNKDEGVFEHIFDANLDILWFELNPEWFLSQRALKKNEKELFCKQIAYFTQMLKKVADKKNKQPPHIFMGTDITSNFAHAPVINPVKDIYGKIYTKIPSPLDREHFWKPEVCEVITQFCALWKESLGNGLSLDGIFLDLEMYHAPTQSGQFTPAMDFSDTAWRCYVDCAKKPFLRKIILHNDRINYLLDNHCIHEYYQALEAESFAVGRMIKNHIASLLPQAIIGVYNIHLPYNWFYKSFCAGLSSLKNPLIFATFNTQFFTHHAWLLANNIHAFHTQVLLLSQLTDQDNFNIIKGTYKYHDGLWVNRFSRLEESRDKKEWGWDWGLETTPLQTYRVIELLNQISF